MINQNHEIYIYLFIYLSYHAYLMKYFKKINAINIDKNNNIYYLIIQNANGSIESLSNI